MKNIIYDNNMAFLSESYDENDAILQQDVLWDDFKDEFTRFMKNQVFVAIGIVKKWDKKVYTCFLIDEFDRIIDLVQNCDNFIVYDDDQHLYIDCYHHDGINRYEIRKLNKSNTEKIKDLDQEKLSETLRNEPYSSRPKYSNLVYGI